MGHIKLVKTIPLLMFFYSRLYCSFFFVITNILVLVGFWIQGQDFGTFGAVSAKSGATTVFCAHLDNIPYSLSLDLVHESDKDLKQDTTGVILSKIYQNYF